MLLLKSTSSLRYRDIWSVEDKVNSYRLIQRLARLGLCFPTPISSRSSSFTLHLAYADTPRHRVFDTITSKDVLPLFDMRQLKKEYGARGSHEAIFKSPIKVTGHIIQITCKGEKVDKIAHKRH